MQISNRAGLSDQTLTALAARVPAHGTLMEVMQWAAGQIPPLALVAVITQDEYTHDLALRWRDDLFLVYGAT
jgi:hypothetical protein